MDRVLIVLALALSLAATSARGSPGPDDYEARLALARKLSALIDISQLQMTQDLEDENFNIMLRVIRETGLPKEHIPPEQLHKIVREEFESEFIPRLVEKGAEEYARDFSMIDLKSAYDFYNGDLGRRFVALFPKLASELGNYSKLSTALLMRNIWLKYCLSAECSVDEQARIKEVAATPK